MWPTHMETIRTMHTQLNNLVDHTAYRTFDPTIVGESIRNVGTVVKSYLEGYGEVTSELLTAGTSGIHQLLSGVTQALVNIIVVLAV